MAQRKLQQEIDRVFKRVAEGVQAFDAVYDKVMTTTNQSQKEKLEQDLKREIKKLQRLRDQIKTWMGSNDIKDKKSLVDQRKLIETQMERFKACEKEMKTKAYSKEGLSTVRLDPREREKMEMGNFITSMIDDLDRQVEQLEAELETLQVTMRRGKKDAAKAERLAETEYRIEQHKWHQSKLEVMLRLLENGDLEANQVANIQEDIKYYVESNQDLDFASDDEMYDSLNLDEEDDIYGMHDNDHQSQDAHSTHGEDEKKEINTPTVPLLIAKKAEPTAVRKVSTKSAAPPPPSSSSSSAPAVPPLPHLPSTSSVHASTITSAAMKPAPAPARPAGESLKYASAAAAAAAATPGLAPLPPPPSAVPASTAAAAKTVAEKTQARGSSTASSPALSSATVATSTSSAWQNGAAAEQKSEGVASKSGTGSERSNVFSLKDMEAELSRVSAAQAAAAKSATTASAAAAAAAAAKANNEDLQARDKTPDLVRSNSSAAASEEESIFHLPAGLQDLVSGYEAAKERLQSAATPDAMSKMVEVSFASCPEAVDATKPKHYQPKTPFPTSAYFPREPLAIFDDPLLYEKVDIDTLFYLFYYRQGTYQQYLAAQELKKQSWRFHKKFLTWFQRHEEPKIITDEFEQGTYRYFDFEGTWLQRRKANFEFEYQYLEDEI
ncbi:CCR4-NOT transcription complex, subunit 3 [Myxozyma melibiosi]|uniref:General negative regulator of transcription subunit n=1 Tax=Myxozyma melibiosi TaxID=54550 RepID=A0ABR1F7D3_9ASCO